MMKRIYLKAFAQKNFGDDLFVRILCERYPETRFYISCPTDADQAFEKIQNLTIMNRKHWKGSLLQNFRRLLKKTGMDLKFPFDGQVYIGGSVFIEPAGWNRNHGYEALMYRYKQSRKLPFFILGANFGPYKDPAFLEIHKRYFANEVQDLCFRDQQSKDLFPELKNVRFAPDIVCTLEIPKREKEPLVLISCIYDHGVEGVEPFDNQLYEDQMVRICKNYQKAGKKVCLLTFCGKQKDQVMCERIRRRVNHPDIFTEAYEGDLDRILELFARAEYVITSRFHGMILGWLARIPVFPISYNNKTRQVIEDYGFEGQHCSVSRFSELDFSVIHENFAKGYVFDIDRISLEAQKQFAVLDHFLKESESD